MLAIALRILIALATLAPPHNGFAADEQAHVACEAIAQVDALALALCWADNP